MASAGLSEVLECSICLNVYTDPVTLSCGHNFCRRCISEALDTQEKSGGYSCPGCRAKFRNRPALQRNTTLHSIVENFLPMKPDLQYTGVSSSLCKEHLRVHNKAPEHVLCAPTTSIKSRKCSIHNRILEFYCTEDSTCVCVYCLIGKHTGHKKETLDTASEKKKKKLSTHLQKLMTRVGETEKSIQSLLNSRREAQEKADGETERVAALFRNLRRRLDDLETKIMSDITNQAGKKFQFYDKNVQQLEMKKEELSRKMRHIEELCNMTDPLTVLQEPDTGDLCNTDEGDNEARDRHDGGDRDVAGISHTLYTGLADIMYWVTGGIYIPPADIILDVNTASNYLHISADRKTASQKDHPNNSEKHSEQPKNHPGTLEKSRTWGGFQYRPQVLSTQFFKTGEHYWEVDVGGSQDWKVGLCYPSMNRKGWSPSVIGYNNKSWCLERKENQYSLLHNGSDIQLPGNDLILKIRIHVDYEAGKISFYNLSDPIRHLHTFTATFIEPLHAAFYVGEGCVKIAGKLRMKINRLVHTCNAKG
ncbi:tripartite motif-containing protein 75-like [Hyperolius riggenbachi]|uniref:tripartite motif-containing protein 75-like n=1 Tax=Hyperolius riggenbachi TaxID=752182 RepID=UPI0035A39816